MQDAKKLCIAWIGTGVMGGPMANHLLKAGHTLRVHSRTKTKAQALIDQGAVWCETPAAAADGSDFAFSMVSVPSDVEATHLGSQGTLSAKRRPRIVIDMTTSRPSLAMEIQKIAASRNVGSLDAPVSGGDIGARNATLSIMVGGDETHFNEVAPLFRKLGKQIVHHGAAGAGQHAKMANQILVASNMIGMCECLLYAKTAGLDLSKVIESVGSGAAGSWAINNLGPRIVKSDFNPGFYVEHFIKDLEIALQEAERMKLALPGLALARKLYETVRNQGFDRLGTHVLYKVLASCVEARAKDLERH